MCRKTIGRCLTPSARAASTWSLSRWASIEPRSSRAKIGICTTATAKMTVHWLGWLASAAMVIASSRMGMRQHHVDDPHQDGVDPAAERAGQDAEDSPPMPARSGSPDDADEERLPGADDQPGEQVASPASRRRAGNRDGRPAIGLGGDLVDQQLARSPGSCGAIHGREDRDQDEQSPTIARADERRGIASQSAARRPATGSSHARRRRFASSFVDRACCGRTEDGRWTDHLVLILGSMTRVRQVDEQVDHDEMTAPQQDEHLQHRVVRPADRPRTACRAEAAE